MWELINHPSNVVFSIALSLMLFFGVIEIFSLFMGGISDWLDGLLPDNLAGDLHSEVGIDASGGAFFKLLSWLYVGKIPILIWLTVFLAVYGGGGLMAQNVVHSMTGHYLPAVLAALGMLFVSMPVVRACAAGLYKVIPKDETTAINSEDLLGRVAEVILGEARVGSPAQAKVKDQYGQTHYIMVEPDGEDSLPQGSKVLLVSSHAIGFKAILNPHHDLM